MKEVVRSGQWCSFIVAVLAVVAAPTIFYGEDDIFSFFQTLNGIYFIPLLTIIMVGMFNKYVDGNSALLTLIAGLSLMIAGTFFGGGEGGWLEQTFKSGFHYMGAVFLFLVILQLCLGAVGCRRESPFVREDAKVVDLTPWKPAPIVGGCLILFALSIYIFFAL